MYYSLISSMKKSSFDADAQAFITAAAITNSIQQTAINSLVVSLKSYGIWSKMKALYPMVGGTAASHKFNLKDPRDLNAAFRLTFNGGWTHSSNGALPNGTNGYADTYLSPALSLTLNNTHLSFYSKSDVLAADKVSMGFFNAAYTISDQMLIRASSNNFIGVIDNAVGLNYVNSNSLGNYIVSRTASNLIKNYKNNNLMATGSSVSVGLSNNTIFLSARREEYASNLPQLFDNKQVAFASIGNGLTDTEASNFYTAVQAYQTSLSRQV